jgi:predicted Zn-dependent protease
LLLQKNYDAALLKFKTYLVNKPKNCEAVNGAAQCYDATNKIGDAIVYYTKLSQLKCAKQSDVAYLKLSELFIKNKQPEQAKQILQKAMQSKYLDIAEQAKRELDKL